MISRHRRWGKLIRNVRHHVARPGRPSVLPFLVGCVLAAAPLRAQVGVPSPEEFLQRPIGERFTDYSTIRAYFIALADASDRVIHTRYGASVDGRELMQVVIGTPANLARLETILALNEELTSGRTTEDRARVIAASNPAVVYFSFGIHGDEAASSEAAMWIAHDLAAGAGGAAEVLDSLIVVIDPVSNPDGRERYVQWYRSVSGATPNADPQSLEHRQPWPGGRYNHYLFDLNRDWAFQTQPETRARIATWWRWNPQVHVDFHEMSPTSTYFFFPAAAPINPIYSPHVKEWWGRIGEANARVFDARGWPYYTSENFDMLYPGYGDTWPTLHGAIGMTYEQAGGGSAGLAYARDRDTLTLASRASQHRVAGEATLRTIASAKTRLLLDFAGAHRTAGIGEPDILLVPGSDPERFDRLIERLLSQGVEVERAASQVRISATPYPGFTARRDFPAGTALVRARQPRGRLAVTLLQPVTDLQGEYSYDISAWSLPYAYGVEAHQTRSAPAARWPVAAPGTPRTAGTSQSTFGYLVPPVDGAREGIVRYLHAGGTVRVLARPATFAGRQWPAGTWFVAASGTGDSSRLEDAGLGQFLTPVSGGLSQSGIDLGSTNAPLVSMPAIALVGGENVYPPSFGAHWFYLEQVLRITPTTLTLRDLPTLDLSRYDVIILPDMSADDVDQEITESLGEWVRGGGHLIGVAEGAEVAAVIGEVAMRERQPEEDDNAALDRLLESREERERREWREDVPGAILPVRLDPGHPFAWGAAADGSSDRLFILHLGGRSFEPMEGAEAVAAFAPNLRAISGPIAPERLTALERSAWLTTLAIGRGDITLFADDPLFRLFWEATKPLYLNALLYGGL